MMAAYNAAPFIEDAIASLLRQRDAAAFDIIVVNDGSTDGTGDIVSRLADQTSEIRLIETPNQGVTRTRNVLIDAIAGDTDFVTLLDSDDLSPAGRFARDLSRFAADPSLELSFGDSLLFRKVGPDRLTPDFSSLTIRVRGVQMGAGLYRTDLIRRTGRYDESLRQGEDLDYMLRLFEQQPRYVVTDDVNYFYRRHASNMTSDVSETQRGVARAIMLAARRKKALGLPPLPRGVFDMKEVGELAKLDRD